MAGCVARFQQRFHFGASLIAACCMMCVGCRTADNGISPIFICELRVPKALTLDPKTTRVSLASWSGESGHFLWAYNQKEQKEEGGFLLFQPDDFMLSAEPESRRALIIEKYPAPAQVFRLALPRSPKPRNWSQWQRPDYLAKGDVGWSIIYDQKMDGVSSNVPPDCFEMRYKIEMQDLGPSWNPGMKRKKDVPK